MAKTPKPPPRPPQPAVVKRPGQWPFGEPGTPSFRFCGAESADGRPYCQIHVRKAYVPLR